MKLWWAHLDTANFSFDAFAESETGARAVMRGLLDEHVKQYGRQPYIINGTVDDIVTMEIRPGAAFRDYTEVAESEEVS